MHNYEELIDKIDKTAAAFSNHLGDNNMSDFLKEPIEAIKQLVAERAELLAKVEMLERELAATQHVVAQFSEGERKLRKDAERYRAIAGRIQTDYEAEYRETVYTFELRCRGKKSFDSAIDAARAAIRGQE